MKKIMIADATLRSGAAAADGVLGFKEKIGIIRQLERLRVDVIETAPLRNGKSDVLLLHSASSIVSGVLSCPADLNEQSLRAAWDAVKGAKHPRLHLLAPVSTVQMEYCAHQKPPAVLESIRTLTRIAREELNAELEVSLLDATRAEPDFLAQAAAAAVEGGADILTLCDSAGTLFPMEFAAFITRLTEAVPQVKSITLSVECSDALHMATASAAVCMNLGVTQFKAAIQAPELLNLSDLADLLRLKGRSLDVTANLDMTAIHKFVGIIAELMQGPRNVSPASELAEESSLDGSFRLSQNDDMESVASAVSRLGYELSADDLGKVYEEFQRIASKKEIGSKDLDAIVATVAVQAPPVYRLKSFVITSGNIINAMAHVILEKDNEEVQGLCDGDGPVDAAFRSIESILGRHFELDDFKISAVTEGQEAVGSSVVRLRSNGKLYSGKGVSTDIIGAAIRAYLNALNKICFDEEEKA